MGKRLLGRLVHIDGRGPHYAERSVYLLRGGHQLLLIWTGPEGIAILKLLLSVALVEDGLSRKLSVKGGSLSLNSLTVTAL